MSLDKKRLISCFLSAIIIFSLLSTTPIPPVGGEVIVYVDDDNDGIPNSEDICVDGNGIVILSIDYFESLDSTDIGTECDAYFTIAIDGDCDGYIAENEVFDSEKFYFLDHDIVEEQGYGNGLLWHGVDVPDDASSVDFYIKAYDRDEVFNNQLDASSDSNSFTLFNHWDIEPMGVKGWVIDSGDQDGKMLEDDVYIVCHLEVIVGTTIRSVQPAPLDWSNVSQNDINWFYMEEGSNTTFSVTDYYAPSTITSEVGCEWYMAQWVDGEWSDWTCVQRFFCDSEYTVDPNVTDPLSYEIFANYRSAGRYLLAVCLFSDMLDDFGLYWYDLKYWMIEIVHKNEVPIAVISHDSDGAVQMDRVSFSGVRSYDIDGDDIECTWAIDGEVVGNGVDLNWMFIDAGYYDVVLTVTDDEGASDSTSVILFVDNLPLPEDRIDVGDVSENESFIVQNDYSMNGTTRTSSSITVPVILGWNLKISISLVERTQLIHEGTAEYDFAIDGRVIFSDLKGTSDVFTLTYMPTIEVMVELMKGDSRIELLNAELPVPLLSNAQDLDANGFGLELPVINTFDNSSYSLTIYTWDKPAVIIDHQIMSDVVERTMIGTRDIEIANIDLFKLAEAVCGTVPNSVILILGQAFDLLDYFANTFLVCDLVAEATIDQDFFLVIEQEGSEFQAINEMKLNTLAALDVDYNACIFQACSAQLTLAMHLEASLKIVLTDAGVRIYSFVQDVFESGLVTAVWKTILNLVSCQEIDLQVVCWTRTLWAQDDVVILGAIDSFIAPSYRTYVVDTDRDGYWDIDDYYPLDPTKHLDDVPPTVVVSPTGGPIGLDAEIVAEFSEEMDKDSVLFVIEGVGGTISWEDNTATFVPDELEYNSAYMITVSGKDLAGNPVEFLWTFYTIEVGDVSGILIGQDGSPIEGAIVRLSNGMSTVTDTDGKFLFRDVLLGDYSLDISVDGYDNYTEEVEVSGAVTTDLGTITMTSTESGSSDNVVGYLPIIIGVVSVLAAIGLIGYLFHRSGRR